MGKPKIYYAEPFVRPAPQPKPQRWSDLSVDEKLQMMRAHAEIRALKLEQAKLEKERVETARIQKMEGRPQPLAPPQVKPKDAWLENYWATLLKAEMVLSVLASQSIDVGEMGRSLLSKARSNTVPDRYKRRFAESRALLGWDALLPKTPESES